MNIELYMQLRTMWSSLFPVKGITMIKLICRTSDVRYDIVDFTSDFFDRSDIESDKKKVKV